MEKYRITVNNTAYDVEVELLQDVPSENRPAETTTPVQNTTDGKTVAAPMPGTILSVNVSVGQSVKQGDVLFILEAMKMENEITSPLDGTVSSLFAKKGDAVSSGDKLCSIS